MIKARTALAAASCFLLCASGCGSDVDDEGSDENPSGTVAEAYATFEYDEAKKPGLFEGGPPGKPAPDDGLGSIDFEPDGDKIWVSDNSRDGRSVGAVWSTQPHRLGARWGVCRNKTGLPFWTRCDKNFPEADVITLSLATCDETKTRTCRRQKDWTIWKTTKPISIR